MLDENVVYEDVSREQVKAENAAERVSRRIWQRLHERGVTGRALAQRLNHGDGWSTGIKQGKWALGLDELDEAATFLQLTPSELVRNDSNELVELRPTEQRLLRAVRQLPPVLRDHLVTHAEFLAGVSPPELEFLLAYRQLTPEEQRRIQHGVDVLRATQSAAPRIEAREHLPETADQATSATRAVRSRRG